MTWRRLRVLLQHLPPESHTMTAIRNATPPEELDRLADDSAAEHGRWSRVEHLLALVADRLARIEYVLVLANTDGKGKRITPPEPIDRPGAKSPAKPKAKLSEVGAERLFQLINGGAS